MFINKTNIKLLAAALLTALAAPSCMNLDETREGGYGYLTISGLDLDVQVEQLVPTKAGESTMDISDLIGENRPELSEVTVTPEQPQEGEPAFYTWTISDGDLRLPAGKYTLSATSGSNDFGTPYFVGSGEVTVSALATAEGTVTFTLGNSVMKVTMAEGFNDHFEPEGDTPVTISGSSGNIAAAMDTYVFVPSGVQLSVKIDGKSSAEIERDYTVDVTPTPATAYDVVLSTEGAALPTIESLEGQLVAWGDRIFITAPAVFTGKISEENKAKLVYEAIEATSPDWNNPKTASGGVIKGLETGTEYKVRARVGNLTSNEISLTPSVELKSSAAHTKTGNDLDGTDVTTTFTSPAQVVTDAISGWTFQLYKSESDGTPLREYTDTDGSVTSDGSLITATDGWPYLPQGTYKLKATATLNDNDNSTVSSMTDIKVGAPEFSVIVSGKTSYSYYTAGDVSTANTKNAETIHDVSSNITIADNILGNSNYSKPTVTYEVDGKTVFGTYSASKTHDHGEISGLSWNSHTLKATVTFDGKESVGECPCVITGLPYSIDFKNQSAAPNWIWNINTDKCKYSSGNGHCICYGYTNLFSGNAFSCSFITPPDENVNVSYITKHYFVNTGWTSAKATIYNGISKDDKTIVKTSSIETESESMGLSDTPIGSREISLPGTGEISNGSRISISCDVTDRAITNKQFIYIYSLEVKYN